MLEDYRDQLSGKVYAPREYVEHQLNMTLEEQDARERMLLDLFAEHDAKKAEHDKEPV